MTQPAQAYRNYLREEIYNMADHKLCYECQRHFDSDGIRLCPLHAAAPSLAAALRQIVDVEGIDDPLVLDTDYSSIIMGDLRAARSVLADIEGGKE